jgi:hypothetical protein
MTIVQTGIPLAPFNEFQVQRQLPHPRLSTFCGREDILEEMKTFLSTSMVEKGNLCKRAVVVLHGMGGIGKSQIALEYIYRSLEDYNAVFWINATDSNTWNASSREIAEMLISHYATKYHGERSFADIATDLGIPGQIDNGGLLSERVAKEAWPYIRKWLARDGNSGWCLIVDGLNVLNDTEKMQEMLPACAYGHVVATSRVRVPGVKLIEVLEIDKESGLRILLGQAFDTVARDGELSTPSSTGLSNHSDLSCSQLTLR